MLIVFLALLVLVAIAEAGLARGIEAGYLFGVAMTIFLFLVLFVVVVGDSLGHRLGRGQTMVRSDRYAH